MKKIVHYIALDVHKETIAASIAPWGEAVKETDILAALARRSRKAWMIYWSETQGGSFLATLG